MKKTLAHVFVLGMALFSGSIAFSASTVEQWKQFHDHSQQAKDLWRRALQIDRQMRQIEEQFSKYEYEPYAARLMKEHEIAQSYLDEVREKIQDHEDLAVSALKNIVQSEGFDDSKSLHSLRSRLIKIVKKNNNLSGDEKSEILDNIWTYTKP